MKRMIPFIVAAVMIISVVGLRFSNAQQSGPDDVQRILQKLDKILANQSDMKEDLQEVKKELEIVKVRASR